MHYFPRHAQSILTLRLQHGGSGANCTTGSLSDYWTRSSRSLNPPKGLYAGFSRGPMGLPSNLTRTIAINADSTVPAGTLEWTVVVPAGSCRGGNQTATVNVTVVKGK